MRSQPHSDTHFSELYEPLSKCLFAMFSSYFERRKANGRKRHSHSSTATQPFSHSATQPLSPATQPLSPSASPSG